MSVDLAAVAAAYRLGIAEHRPAVQEVMKVIGRSRAQSTRYITAARDAGLLGDDERAPRGAAAYTPPPTLPRVGVGQRFVTTSESGRRRVWEVSRTGIPVWTE